jgi:uncharacterized BrkB/YihY/UPF0761 family membrane protein
LGSVVRWLDGQQRRHRSWAVVVGVATKRADDGGGWLGALIGHYLFLSALPLLTALTWITSHLMAGDPSLRRRVDDTLVGQLPVVGDQLRHGAVQGSGLGLVVTLGLALFAGLAVLVAAQRASDTAWGVPRSRQRGNLATRLRSLPVVAGVAAAAVAWALLSGLLSALGAVPVAGRLLAAAVGLAFLALLATALLAALARGQRPRWWGHWPGGVAAAAGWTVLSVGASAFIEHQVVHWGAVYGTFALVMALVAWMALIGQTTVVAMELDVVLARHLHPRRLGPGPATEADQRAAGLVEAAVARTSTETGLAGERAEDTAVPA